VTVIEAVDWHRLIPSHEKRESEDEDRVWGVAYRVDPERVVEVRAYLGVSHFEQNREINWLKDGGRRISRKGTFPFGHIGIGLIGFRMGIRRMRCRCTARHSTDRRRRSQWKRHIRIRSKSLIATDDNVGDGLDWQAR